LSTFTQTWYFTVVMLKAVVSCCQHLYLVYLRLVWNTHVHVFDLHAVISIGIV